MVVVMVVGLSSEGEQEKMRMMMDSIKGSGGL